MDLVSSKSFDKAPAEYARISAKSTVSCLVCGSTDLAELAHLDDGSFRKVLRCRDCLLEFVSPLVAGKDSVESAVTAPDYIRAMVTEYQLFLPRIKTLAQRRLAFYTAMLGRRPESILEVGAGTGWMVKEYQDRGLRSTGIELDANLVSLAQEQLGLPLIRADITNLDVDRLGSSFDIVCSSQTLEHILAPRTALSNIVKATRPGGIVHIDVPNANSWGSRVRRIYHEQDNWGAIQLPHHQFGYHPATLRRLFEIAGLEDISVSERPTSHAVFGQTILPTSFHSRLFIQASKLLGHGYLLVGLARKPLDC
jgi:SAM-dependent methyltransferase